MQTKNLLTARFCESTSRRTDSSLCRILCRTAVFFFLVLLGETGWSQGTRLWATYYGGPFSDYGQSIATDASGNVYVSGYTGSSSGIASGGFQNTYGGGLYDAYLVKFNSAGVR